MTEDKKTHPIRRIRDELAQYRFEFPVRTVKDFSRWLGCSESLIRNVENGAAPLSEKLAKSVQHRTGISAEWLLSSPKPEDAILDRRGEPWVPGRLDPFYFLPNLGRLLVACPTLLPGIVAKLVEAQILAEMHDRGGIGTLMRILIILDSRDFFEESKESGNHPLRWLERPEKAEELEALKRLGIDLLMNTSTRESTAEESRDLEHLRVNGPSIPEGTQLPKCFAYAKRRPTRFPIPIEREDFD